MACELSLEYADTIKYGERLRGLIARIEQAMRHREDAAVGNDLAVELRWWPLNSAQEAQHVTGVWRNLLITEYEATPPVRGKPVTAGRARRDIDRIA